MIKTILIPTDFSENAHLAGKYAISMAQKTGAKIIFFHSYYVPIYAENIPIDPITEGNLKADAFSELEQFKKENITAHSEIASECIVRTGNAVESILSVAKELNVDLIVMGTKGSSGISEVIFGSNTEDVLIKTEIPVLAIPEKALYKDLKKIVFATNYHFSDFQAIEDLIVLGNLFDFHITVLHINDGEFNHEFEYSMLDNFRAKVKERSNYPNLYFQLIENKNIYEGLQTFIHQNDIDMIAVTSRKKALYNRLFGRSISKKMAFHTDIPLLVFKINQDDEITEF
ncbi:MAG: universal stress protein [Bacteroidota bacterium]